MFSHFSIHYNAWLFSLFLDLLHLTPSSPDYAMFANASKSKLSEWLNISPSSHSYDITTGLRLLNMQLNDCQNDLSVCCFVYYKDKIRYLRAVGEWSLLRSWILTRGALLPCSYSVPCHPGERHRHRFQGSVWARLWRRGGGRRLRGLLIHLLISWEPDALSTFSPIMLVCLLTLQSPHATMIIWLVYSCMWHGDSFWWCVMVFYHDK
jgi:hypothetical protein